MLLLCYFYEFKDIREITSRFKRVLIRERLREEIIHIRSLRKSIEIFINSELFLRQSSLIRSELLRQILESLDLLLSYKIRCLSIRFSSTIYSSSQILVFDNFAQGILNNFVLDLFATQVNIFFRAKLGELSYLLLSQDI